jgi:hypothetical protein
MKKIIFLIVLSLVCSANAYVYSDLDPNHSGLSLGEPDDPNHYWRAAISRIWNLTTDGYVRVSDNNGVLGVDGNSLSPSSHSHNYGDINETTSANWQTRVSDESGTGVWIFVNISTLGKNDTIKWTGSGWRDANSTDTYTFSIATFSDSISATQEIGSGTWKAIGALTFTATYNNGPPDATPYVAKSTSGGTNTWASNLNMTTSPAFEGPTTNTIIVTHRTSVGTITFTLYAQSGTETSNTVETVTFYNKRHWGVTTEASGWDSSDIGNLASNELSNSKAKTFTVTAGAGEYILYAYPSRLGTATFTVGGFEGGFESPATVSRTNDSGFVENYYVYRSTNANLGATTVVAQ